MDRTITIWLHAAAPAKPAIGSACNGCGVCCASEPCPAGILVSLSRRGRCRALTWDAARRRYRCGLIARLEKTGSPHVPGWREQLLLRWIGAGVGCDSSATTDRH